VDSPRKYSRRREQAAALIIVLALVVLATGLTVAYFSRTTADRPVANSSFNQATVDQLSQSGMENVIGDLRQEITNGSAPPSPTPNDSTSPFPFSLYVPTSSSNIVPVRNPTAIPGTTPAIPNLIRRSVRLDTIPSPARASRASAVNSTADISANGRSVSLARWNSHYLIRRANATSNGDYESEPITTGFTGPNYWAPDWVYVNNNGVTQISDPDNSIIGRYAYMIYDEGALLDMNAAGYPSPTTILQYGRKGSLAFADLTGPAPYALSTPAVDNIVGWRNYASSQPNGSFSPTPNFSFSANATNTYYNFILSDPNYIKLPNFLINQNPPLTYSPIFFLGTAWQAPQFNSQTDQGFTTRQHLIAMGKKLGFSSNALEYLGTSSREALASAPQWSPASPDSTNPNFQALLVTSQFTRNDGTTAYVGDYLVNQRFLLQRLNWLTYKGPSAAVANGGTRNAVPASAPSLTGCIPVSTTCAPDYDLWLLTRPNGITFGLTSAFLQQGTAANVLKYFGLAWNPTYERWDYVGHGGASTPIDSIATLASLTGTREPDFFEILQAGILSGSLGDAFSPDPTALPLAHQQSKVLHILTIGASLIAQSRVDSYPVRIACTVNIGGNNRIVEAVGMPRLPYISGLAVCPVGGTGSTGGVNWLLVPNLWDPFRDTWDLTEANTGNTGNGPNLTPGYLRPPVRITVSGNLGFGTATASQSGSVDPVSLTTFSTTLSVNPALSLTLATGNSTFGRDGLLEASRIGTSDVTPTPTPFTTTTSVTTAAAQWNNVVRPPRPDGTLPGTTNFVVFRVSLPGSGITTTGQNPVLILKPGFQVTMEYQSPNGNWYPYSFLQGNRATDGVGNPVTDTWISSNLNLATTFSQYQQTTGFTAPTVVNAGTSNVTRWDQNTVTIPGGVTALAQAPMFAKADPRSIRYNSQIGVVSLASPPMAVVSAGIIGSIWPNTYTTPPPMIPGPSPAPTPTPNANPATYSQLGDNGPAASDPYNEANGDTVRPIIMNRPFRSVGEMGYAFRDQPFRSLSFSSSNSPDAGLLDLFTTVAYGVTPTPSPSPSISPSYPTPTVTPRGGVISLNSLQARVLAAVLGSTIRREDTPRVMNSGVPSPVPSPVANTHANNVATYFVSSATPAPLVNRADLANWIANLPDTTGVGPSSPKTQRESIARALGEVGQTRTWNLMLDVIAQSGRYPPNATSLRNGFVVDGEQRYWVHVAIDRFTGQVIDKKIEVVNE
jgi:hypothetical protein